jgi:hypothetical protein
MIETPIALVPTAIWNPLEWPSAVYFLLIVAVLGLRWRLPESPRRSLLVARELGLLLPAVLLYFAVRGLVDAREADAVRNAGRIIDLERTLGLLHEERLQGWILQSGWLVDLMNWVYIWGHWPVLAATALWLLLRHPREYPVYRNALLVSGAVGMFIFALFPVAPPRLMPDMAFVDTVTQQSQSYRVLQPTSLTNPYAAVPSFHFGWNLLMGIAIARLASGRFARVFGALMPVAMLLAIVLTANHYFLDAAIGGALVLGSLWAASRLAARAEAPNRARRHHHTSAASPAT